MRSRKQPALRTGPIQAAFIPFLIAIIYNLPSNLIAASQISPQFNVDIRPIISDNCLSCHGPDSAKRKANLRLDTREGLYGQTKDEGMVITPGSPEKSALWRRIVTADKDELMPPPDSHKSLTEVQKVTIKTWIQKGAAWQTHWALLKPTRPQIPKVRNSRWVRNPIDNFVLSALENKDLTPATEADRRTLARRMALDATGLPPSKEQVVALEKNRKASAIEDYIEQLQNSKAWGEHRARYWLDAARYADTHGLHFDNYREMWPYRDWVINAFNANQGYDTFTRDQLAGDLLPDPTQEQLVATGFHRCAMSTNEGGTIEEENLVNYAQDRVTTTGWVYLGLTMNCASCHDHKFDPISTKDFYSMAAFFRNTTQPGYDGNVKDSTPSITVVSDKTDLARWKSLPTEIEKANKFLAETKTKAQSEFSRWVSTLKRDQIEKQIKAYVPTFHAPLISNETGGFQAVASGTPVDGVLTGKLSYVSDDRFSNAHRFEKGATLSYKDAGDYDTHQSFSIAAWVFVPENHNEASAIVSRMDENNDFRGWDLWIQQGQFASHIVSKWPSNAIKVRTKKSMAKKNQWQHLVLTYNGSGKPNGVRLFVDGKPSELETENGAGITESIRTATPLKLAQRSSGAHFDGVRIQDLRIYSNELKSTEADDLANLTSFLSFVEKPLDQWNKEVRDQAIDYYLRSKSDNFKQAQQHLSALEKEQQRIKAQNPVTLVQKEKLESQPMAQILFRGMYDKPKEKVGADIVSVLHKFPDQAPRNRLGLAQWLMSSENPLTSRVTVNRFWQEVFGTGLVRTVEDFGVTGESPSNQALLDWLAVEFIESGWDVKHLFKLMMSSATYRQSATTTPEKLEKDPFNRLLSRGPKFRMDAEMIRDYALASSSLLKKHIGGPSVKPYQPEGVWEAVAMPESNTRRYQKDSGDALYRRSLYTFWKRSAPPALMDIFNAPSRESCTVKRERTNTPLQALATLNDPQFVEAAIHIASQSVKTGGNSTTGILNEISWKVLARPLTRPEVNLLKANLKTYLEFFQTNSAEAQKFISVGEKGITTPVATAEIASWAMIANQLLNLDEALCK